MRNVLFLLLLTNLIYGQSNVLTSGDTYAIVVGVSSYSDKSMNLNFAEKDANYFAEYLMSQSGGSVPQSNIKLLLDQNATIAKFEKELQWLLRTVKYDHDDLVYIYFSGHGSIQSQLNQGYLLAHDSPSDAFLSNAIHLYQINRVSDELSKRGAKIRIIIDACYAGNLHGIDNIGANLEEEEKKRETANVIRITSSKHNERSYESSKFGNGRGAFSFHLIEALQGKADEDNNMEVQQLEFAKYLENKVKRDVNRKVREDQNAAVIGGKETDKLAIVDSIMLANLNDPTYDPEVIKYKRTKLQDYLMELGKIDLKDTINFSYWRNKSKDQIIDSVLVYTDSLLIHHGLNDYYVKSSEDFDVELAVIIQNNVRRYLNALLVGDDEEMVRRGFYRPTSANMAEYVDMLEVAMKLVGEEYSGYNIMKTKMHYFKGVTLRLKSRNAGSPEGRDSLLRDAIIQQNLANELDENVAYVHNELGVLHGLLGDGTSAMKSFNRAVKLDVNWALPLSNLSFLWYNRGEYSNGRKFATRAVKLQPKYINSYINLGLNSMQMNNYLLAEESFLKACNLHYDSYSGFENLGMVYLLTGRYNDANRNFKIQDSINGNYIYPLVDSIALMEIENSYFVNPAASAEVAPVFTFMEAREMVLSDDIALDTNNVIQLLAYGMSAQKRNKIEAAKNCFERVLSLEENPLAYYSLSKIAYIEQDYQSSEKYALQAKASFVETDAFIKHLEELSIDEIDIELNIDSTLTTMEVDSAFVELNMDSTLLTNVLDSTSLNVHEDSLFVIDTIDYNSIWIEYCEVNYFTIIDINNVLADLYTDMGYLEKASNLYQQRIDSLGVESPEFQKLLSVYQSKGLYTKAESLIRNNCASEDRLLCDKELYYLYEAATDDYYAPSIFHYKAAEKLYDLIDVAESCGIDSLVQKCVAHYAKALQYSSDSEKEDIYIKIGELYKSQKIDLNFGSELSSVLDSIPDSDMSKVSIIPILIDMGESWKAYEYQIDLFRRAVLDYENLDLLYYQSIQAGDFDLSDSLLVMLQGYPVDSTNVLEKKALKNLISNNLELALGDYQKLYEIDSSKVEVVYTLARLNAQLGNRDIALTYLDESVEKGFDYYWVLRNDLYIRSLYDSEIYQQLVEEFKPNFIE